MSEGGGRVRAREGASGAGGDAPTAFALSARLIGRAPEGPPLPRVLDVLLFRAAQTRFLVARATEGERPAGGLPWQTSAGAAPHGAADDGRAGGREAGARGESGARADGGEDARGRQGRARARERARSWQDNSAALRDNAPALRDHAQGSRDNAQGAGEELRGVRDHARAAGADGRGPHGPGVTHPAAGSGRQSPGDHAAGEGAASDGPPAPASPPTLRYRFPARRAAAQPLVPSGGGLRTGDGRNSAEAAPSAPLPFASAPEIPTLLTADPGRSAGAEATRRPASLRSSAGGGDAAAGDSANSLAAALAARPGRASPAPDLPWPDPLRGGAAPDARAPGPFGPSAARSAAEMAERVARAAIRRRRNGRPVPSEAAPEPDLPPPPRPSRPAPRALPAPRSAPITPEALVREVTRDEVVRALVSRMRALAKDERFRLGELR